MMFFLSPRMPIRKKKSAVKGSQMKTAYEFVADKKLLRAVWNGTLSRDDLLECVCRFTDNLELTNNKKNILKVILDIRAAEIGLTADEMETFVRRCQQIGNNYFLAIVVSRPSEFGMARMFEMLSAAGHLRDFDVFYDPEQAEKWVESKDIS
jgi:hypothetical protein